jgi:adenine deaminase
MEKLRINIVDVISRRTFLAEMLIENGIISQIIDLGAEDPDLNYVLPGFVDAHVHIESSMISPAEFARLAVRWGTIATVSDPHEIANVLGVDGVELMLRSGRQVPFKFYFGVPSCVPATDFETSGARLDASDVDNLLSRNDFLYLSEMMNFPGVVYQNDDVMAKLAAAKKYNKPIDGHAPGLTGDLLFKYVSAGVATDHECSNLDEAIEKIALGMQILIREGSAAKNFSALHPLFNLYPDKIMLCSDDLHPDDLLNGHINLLVKKALALNYNFFDVISSVTLHPKKFYNLSTGLVQINDSADFIVVDNLSKLQVISTYIGGERVFHDNEVHFPAFQPEIRNTFFVNKLSIDQVLVKAQSNTIKVILAEDGELLTKSISLKAKIENGFVMCDTERDIAKLLVLNRYKKAEPAIAFIKGFGLFKGALASTVAHDSHNIVAVATNNDDLLRAVALIQNHKGALVAVSGNDELVLPLEIAGIMSALKGEEVAELYHKLNRKAAEFGSGLRAPYMTLAFMSLLVIPALKLGDKGLFDGENFVFTSLFVS